MPHLVVEQVGVAGSGQHRHRAVAVELRAVLHRRATSRVVAARHHLRRAEIHRLDRGERREQLQGEAGQRHARVVAGDVRGQRELHQVVDVPAAGTVRHRVGLGVGEQRVLRHAVAVVAEHRFRQAGERLAHDQVAERVVVLEHAHQREAAAVVAGLTLLHRGVGQLALHRRAQRRHLLRLQHRSERAVAVTAEAFADARGFRRRAPLALQDRARHGAEDIPRQEPRNPRPAAALRRRSR